MRTSTDHPVDVGPHSDQEREGEARARSRWTRGVDFALAVAVLGVLAIAPLAHRVADEQPVAAAAAPAVATRASAPEVRTIPVGIESDRPFLSLADVRPVATGALGEAGGAELVALVAADDVGHWLAETAVGGTPGFAPYPYRYPALTRLLATYAGQASTAELTSLGAALMVLSARHDSEGRREFYNAAPAAYATLDHARADGACDPQLNLLALVAADDQPRDDVVVDEAARAVRACPDEPTPGWVLGQFQSQRATLDWASYSSGDPLPDDAQERATRTFDDLVAAFPDSAAARLGQADAQLRSGFRLASRQPFTARMQLRAAATTYRQLLNQGVGDAAPGLASALLAIGQAKEAASVIGARVDGWTPASSLGLLLKAQEAAHDFDGAERTARRLHALGEAAYPQGNALFASPGVVTVEPFVDSPILVPLSQGADEWISFGVDLQPGPGGADATVEDTPIIPVFREDFGYTGSDRVCPDWAWRRDAVLAGRAETALADYPPLSDYQFKEVAPDAGFTWCGPGLDAFRELVLAESQPDFRPTVTTPEELADRRQNLWRWADDLDRAEAVVASWPVPARHSSPLPMLRLGEIQYLRGEYDDAAASFGVAARRARAREWDNDLAVLEALLDRGVALLAAGRSAEGRALLRDVDSGATGGYAYQQDQDNYDGTRGFAVVAYYARAKLADDELRSDEHRAAIEDYVAAGELVPLLTELGARGFHPDAVYANHAVAEIGLDNPEEARRLMRLALARDPQSPPYLMTAGYAAWLSGDHEAAEAADRAALASDPGAYPVANDLGIVLADRGDEAGAERAFRQAIGMRPDYALGWFNLGVLYADAGPGHVLQSQGALARAFALDPDLKDRARSLAVDTSTYATGLDVSKPLPAAWSFDDLERTRPLTTVGLLAVLVAAVGLARARGGQRHELVERWLEPATTQLDRLLPARWLRHPGWSVAAVLGCLSVPLLVRGWPGVAAAAVYVGALAIIVAAAMRARLMLARHAGVATVQETWLPSVVVGVVLAPFGAWAPMPIARATEDVAQGHAKRIHAAAPLTAAALAAALFVEAAWFPVPLTSSLAIATLVIAASLLPPIKPLDGAFLGRTGAIAGLGILAAALLVLLGLP